MILASADGQVFRPQAGKPIEILLVEDSASDAAMTREALRDSPIINRLHHVDDGEQAMQFLFGRGRFAGRPFPDLVILDLNLPRMDGREVLTEIRKSPLLRALPVVVLTTSAAEADVLAMYERHANAYVVKPVGFDAFLRAVQSIEGFWLSLVRLPPHPEFDD